MNFSIRKAKESDADAIAQILQKLGWFAWINSTSQEKTSTQVQIFTQMIVIPSMWLKILQLSFKNCIHQGLFANSQKVSAHP